VNRTACAGRSLDWLLIPGAVLGIVAAVTPWLSFRDNRLAAGQPVGLTDAAGPALSALILLVWIVCCALIFVRPGRRVDALLGSIGAAMLSLTLVAAGLGASHLVDGAPATARVSLGPGTWLSLAAAYIVLHAARSRLAIRPVLRFVVAAAGPIVILLMGMAGGFDDLSLMREYANTEQRFLTEIARHILLATSGVIIGATIAVPLGILATRSKRVERPVFAVTSAFETVPSLALFGLLMAPLTALSYAFPVLRDIGIRGVGAAPALIALVIYSLLPIVHNTYAGLRQIDPATLDAARGMGMSRSQVVWRVEFPLAAPVVGAGLRTASVQAIGNTTVAALIGAGGLGHFIFQGLGQAAPDLILLGTLPVIGLAVIVDVSLAAFIHAITPTGLKLEAET